MSSTTEPHPMNWLRGYDPKTLRELIDPVLAHRRLFALKDSSTLAADAESVTLLRVLGRLDEALELAGKTVQRARAEGTPAQVTAARIRLGQVHQFRGETEAAVLWLRSAEVSARSQADPVLHALAKLHEGKTLFEAGLFDEAATCFRSAYTLRAEAGAGPAHLEPVQIAITLAEQCAANKAASAQELPTAEL